MLTVSSLSFFALQKNIEIGHNLTELQSNVYCHVMNHSQNVLLYC